MQNGDFVIMSCQGGSVSWQWLHEVILVVLYIKWTMVKREDIWWMKYLQRFFLFKYVDLQFLQLLFMCAQPVVPVTYRLDKRWNVGFGNSIGKCFLSYTWHLAR
jgi:hypothetical protein